MTEDQVPRWVEVFGPATHGQVIDITTMDESEENSILKCLFCGKVGWHRDIAFWPHMTDRVEVVHEGRWESVLEFSPDHKDGEHVMIFRPLVACVYGKAVLGK